MTQEQDTGTRAGVRVGLVWFGRFGLVWFGLIRLDLVRFGSVRFGLVRFGSVWFGLGGLAFWCGGGGVLWLGAAVQMCVE